MICNMYKPDIVCITETWLHSEILLSECCVTGYSCLRCDRDTRGGGVAVFVNTNFDHQVLLSKPDGLEFLLVAVHKNQCVNTKVHIGLWYRPPSDSAALDTLYNLLGKIEGNKLTNLILLGDFNINVIGSSDPLLPSLNDLSNSFVLTQVVREPTRVTLSGSVSLIDLVFLSNPGLLLNCEVIAPLVNSDHNGINLSLKWPRKSTPIVTTNRTMWKYEHADLVGACYLLTSNDWSFIENESSINIVWGAWEHSFLHGSYA